MPFTISTLSPNPSLKPPHFAFNLSPRARNHVIPFRSSSSRAQSFAPKYTPNLLRFSASGLWFSPVVSKRGFPVRAENGNERRRKMDDVKKLDYLGDSTMPEEFRPLLKEAPDPPPVLWPWFLAVALVLSYAWRTVLWELSNWKNTSASILKFVGYLLELVLALIFSYIDDPITSLIRGIGTILYTIRAFYSAVITSTPIPELTTIILLVSTVLAIAETVVPNSVDHQSYLLTTGGIIGLAAVRGFISEQGFWILLVGLFGFARFIKKRDYISSLLPVAAVLAAVGEPWVRVLAITSYLALAIIRHSKKPLEDKDEVEGESAVTGRKVPLPLFCAALAISVRVAAKWAGYRHLTWMIV